MLSMKQQIESQTNGLDPAYVEFRDQTRFWIQRVAVPLLMVIGLFGNLITMIIMTRRRMRSTTNMYLAALAFVDMLYLVLTFLLGLSHYPNMAGCKFYAYWKLKPTLMMLTDACSNTSVWLTVTFTIERYIAVKYPMKGKVWCTEARARVLITCVFVFGILFASPVPFEWKVIEKPIMVPLSRETATVGAVTKTCFLFNDSIPRLDFHQQLGRLNSSDRINGTKEDRLDKEVAQTQSYILALDYTDFGKNETYITIYYRLTAVIFYFIPLFSLMLFNGFLIKSVHQSQRERTKMTGRRSSRPQLTPQLTEQKSVELDMTTLPGNEEIKQPSGSGKLAKDPQMRFKLFLHSWKNKCLKQSSSKSVALAHEACSSTPIIGQNNSAIRSEPNSDGLSRHIFNQSSSLGDDAASSRTLAATGLNGFPRINVHSSCDFESAFDDVSGEIEVGSKTRQTISDEYSTHDTDMELRGMPEESLVKTKHSKKFTISSAPSTSIPTSASTQERRITIMLIAVVILFLVCQIPSAAMLLYTSVREIERNTNEDALVLAFGNIFNFLMAINAAGNFILYSFLSKKYRRTFMILFCHCLGSNKVQQKQHKRMISVRFESSGANRKNSLSIYQNNKASDKIRRDTSV